ncbi:MAG: energy transducer TonB [Sphingomonas bacterium]
MVMGAVLAVMALLGGATEAVAGPVSLPPEAQSAPQEFTPTFGADDLPWYAGTQPTMPVGPIDSWQPYSGSRAPCSATRNYGSVTDPLTVAFEPTLSQGEVQIHVVSVAKDTKSEQGRGAVMLDPGGTTEAKYVTIEHPKSDFSRGYHWSFVTVARAAFDGVAKARTVMIRTDMTTVLPASDVAAAFEMTAHCQARLFESWGIDSTRFGFGKPAPSPRTPPTGWFAYADYPKTAREAHIQGRVLMVLDVGEDGLVKACRVVRSAGPELDDGSCRAAMLRGRFTPARDTRGKPVASWAIIPVRWTLSAY